MKIRFILHLVLLFVMKVSCISVETVNKSVDKGSYYRVASNCVAKPEAMVIYTNCIYQNKISILEKRKRLLESNSFDKTNFSKFNPESLIKKAEAMMKSDENKAYGIAVYVYHNTNAPHWKDTAQNLAKKIIKNKIKKEIENGIVALTKE